MDTRRQRFGGLTFHRKRSRPSKTRSKASFEHVRHMYALDTHHALEPNVRA